jgi:hypothetical protein
MILIRVLGAEIVTLGILKRIVHQATVAWGNLERDVKLALSIKAEPPLPRGGKFEGDGKLEE